jgi:hypothetical protein
VRYFALEVPEVLEPARTHAEGDGARPPAYLREIIRPWGPTLCKCGHPADFTFIVAIGETIQREVERSAFVRPLPRIGTAR